MSKHFIKHVFALILLFFTTLSPLLAQRYTLSGYISDEATGERLPGVNISIKELNQGTVSNTYGYYSITLPPGKYEIIFSFIGYTTQLYLYEAKEDKLVNIRLSESTTQLDVVEVVGTVDRIQERVQMSTLELPASQIKKIPALLGEVDIIKVLQLMPGIQSGNEGASGLYVRGGSPDQNLILLDGVPVYNVSHLFGFFSVFNNDAVRNVRITKGGFPARFGGRLSSVLEVDMKEGNNQKFSGEGGIGLISSRLTLEGPIIKDKTSFMVSGRRTYIDALMAPFIALADDFSEGESFRTGYYFWDFNTKINHTFSNKDKIYFSYYGGLDRFYLRYKYQYDDPMGSSSFSEQGSNHLQWGNNTGTLRWNHLFNPKLFANLTAIYSRYKFEVGSSYKDSYNGANDEFSFKYFSNIEDYGMRYDLEYKPNNEHYVRFGGGYTFHVFKPGVFQVREIFDEFNFDSVLNLNPTYRTHDLFLYAEDEYKVNNRLLLNYGIHLAGYQVESSFFPSIQPRFSMRYMLTDAWAFKASYANMMQFIHLLSNAGLGLPTDLWVSSTDKIKPQVSNQIAAGVARDFKNSEYEFSMELYYKKMDNLIEYREGAGFISNDWESQVETGGQGWAYGSEWFIQKKKGNTTGWIGYTLAWSNRQFENLNRGKVFPYRFDRRHDISIVLLHKVSDKFDMGATWVYGTGNAITLPIARTGSLPGFSDRGFFGFSDETRIYTERNGYRMPAYHRMDLGFNWHKKTKWGMRTWNLSFYNAYSRINPFYIDIGRNPETGKREAYKIGIFPILPSFAYNFKF